MASNRKNFLDEMLGFNGMRNRMFQHSLLTEEETNVLVTRYQTGDQFAGSKLIRHNLRFIYNVTYSFLKQTNPLFWDAFNEGCFGVIRAAEDFDPDRGWKFMTYAVWWIRQRISFFLLNHTHTIFIPAAERTKMKKKILESLPETAIEHKQVRRRGLKAVDLDLKQYIISMDSETHNTVSDSTRKFSNIVPTPEDQDQKISEVIGIIPQVLARLNAVDAKLISDVYGLETGIPKTYTEIAVVQGLSKERIRQKLNRAMQLFRYELKRMNDVDKSDLEVFD